MPRRQRAINAHEKERQRIAVGLHEEVGHLMAAPQLALIRSELIADDSAGSSLVRLAIGLLDKVKDKIRALTFELSDESRFDVGRLPAIEERGQRKETEWDIQVRTNVQIAPRAAGVA